MGAVIYSASPLRAMLGSFAGVVLFFGIGGIGILAAIFRKSQGKTARIIMGLAGAFLLVVGVILAGYTLVSLSSGTQSVTVYLNDKTTSESPCGDDSTCTNYILETSAGAEQYDFNVPQDAYNAAQINTCYQIDFYRAKSFFNLSVETETYHQVNSVTRIEVADPSACQ